MKDDGWRTIESGPDRLQLAWQPKDFQKIGLPLSRYHYRVDPLDLRRPEHLEDDDGWRAIESARDRLQLAWQLKDFQEVVGKAKELVETVAKVVVAAADGTLGDSALIYVWIRAQPSTVLLSLRRRRMDRVRTARLAPRHLSGIRTAQGARRDGQSRIQRFLSPLLRLATSGPTTLAALV